jgi:hypothetical protein
MEVPMLADLLSALTRNRATMAEDALGAAGLFVLLFAGLGVPML